MGRKKKNPADTLPQEFITYLRVIGARGGARNSEKQRQHRRKRAVRAMLHKKFPNDPRWKPESNYDPENEPRGVASRHTEKGRITRKAATIKSAIR